MHNLREMRQDWMQQASRWGASSDDYEKVLNTLIAEYSRMGRHYHNLDHIQAMLLLAKEYQNQIIDIEAFYFAIWFHDVVQSKGGDNEKLSADFAEQELTKLNIPEGVFNKVKVLIVATEAHQYSDDEDCNLFLDIDMAILAEEQSKYRAYSNACRREYDIPDFIFRLGRKRFLKELLLRQSIFNTIAFQQDKELKARENIAWELSVL